MFYKLILWKSLDVTTTKFINKELGHECQNLSFYAKLDFMQ